MRQQGLWTGWMLVLAPMMALAQDGIALTPADDEGPISALNAYAEATGDIKIEVIGEGAVVTGNPDQAAVAVLENLTLELQLAPAGESKYWLGLDCEPAGETLRSQLGLAEKTGLVIVAVADDSPAQAAGLQNNDVVMLAKLGDKELAISNIDQFSELIQQAEAKPINLTVLRGGKSVAVPVTPAERPGVMTAKLGRPGGPAAGKGRGGMMFKLGEPSAKKEDAKPESHRRRGARGHGGRHHGPQEMGHHGRRGWDRQHGRHHASRGDHARKAERGDEVGGRRGRQHARRGHHGRMAHRGDGVMGRRGGHHASRGHHGRTAHRPNGVGGFRGHHPRHTAQRGHFGHHGHFGHLAMLQHGRFGGFAHGGPRQGRHFSQRFALAHRDGRFDRDHHPRMPGHGPQHFQRPTSDAKSASSDVGDKLDAVVKRLEALAGPQGLGRFNSPGPVGRFQPPSANQREGRGGRPEQWRGGDQAERPAREASAEPAPLDQMRVQLRRLQEQQENMMKAMRDLSEALEKQSRK